MFWVARLIRTISLILIVVLLSACSIPLSNNSSEESPQPDGLIIEVAVENPTAISQPPTVVTEGTEEEMREPPPEATEVDSQPTQTVEPEPEKPVNPMTGLPVDDPGVLQRRPLLVSISNFPPTARPQAGLSFASHVYSTFIGFGMNRYVAVFYGDYAEHLQEILNNRLAEGNDDDFAIGPVRSGRVAFEDIKNQYPHALLITAGASPEVLSQLSNQVSVFGSSDESVNNTGVGADALGQFASDYPVDPLKYESLVFDATQPDDGESAEFVRIIYNYLNQNGWKYDPASHTYLRSQDQADGSGDLYPMIDRLTGEQLGFENVVVLWAKHSYLSPTVLEINLSYVWDHFGLLYRDGRVHEIKWSTRNGDLMIYDGEGAPVPLRPGKTWFEVVSFQSTWDRDKSIVRFHEPPSDF
ncbi:MAG: DUF3048 domain-containing protein [Anaerolineales bacterium]|jgi:hypothetical protein|nr:DUF3048 domain-containing protein [Anaerolineales bacterium]